MTKPLEPDNLEVGMQKSPFISLSVGQWGPGKIAALYLVMGSLWILFSDELTHLLTGDLASFTIVSLVKGWVYVVLTTVLLYWLIRRYTAELRQNRRQTEEILDALPALVAYVDADERCQFSNLTYETWFNTPRKEIYGRSLPEIIGETVYQEVAEHMQAALRGESVTWSSELTYQGYQPRFVETILSPRADEQGHIQGFFALITDISRAKQIETALRESELRYRLLAENVSDVIWVLDMQTNRFRYVTPSIERLRGLTVAEALRETTLQAVTPDSGAYLTQVLPERLADFAGGKRLVYTDELQQFCKDGSTIWVEINSRFVLNEENGRLEAYGASRDITARKQAEQALRDSEEKYRSVIETSPDGFWMLDANGRILEVNDTYVHRSGYSRDELLNLHITNLDALETAEETAVHLQTIRQQGSDLFESRHRTKANILWPVEVNVAYWPIEEGRFFVFLRDVTRRKWAETLLHTRLRLSDIAQRGTLSDLMRSTLDEAELLTGSAVGFFHFVEADQETVALQAWSTNTLRHFCQAQGHDRHYPISSAGVWADCIARQEPVVHNDYARLPDKKGLVEGHAEIIRELTVPVLRAGKVVAVMGVGNKTAEYTTDDVILLQELADMAMEVVAHKQTELALRESEERFRQIAEAIDNVFWMTSLSDEQVLYVSPAFERLWGRKAAELYADNRVWLSAIHPDDQATVRTAFERWLKAPDVETYEVEFRLCQSDGQWRWILDRGTALRDENGQVYRLVGMAQDITERRAMEDAIRVNLEKYKALFESFPSGITITDKAGNILEANQASETLLGVPTEEHEDRTISSPEWQIIRPDGSPMPAEEYASVRALQENRIVRDVEMGVVKGSQQVTWINVTAVPIPLPDYGVAISYSDISERRQAEKEIHRLNAELEQRVQQRTAELSDLYNNAPCGYHSLDSEGLYIRINDTEARWLGYAPEELIGQRRFFDLLTPASQATFNENFPRFKERGWVQDLEFDMIRRDGTILPVLLHATVIYDENGRYIMSRSTITDHTERRQTEQMMQQSQAQLQAANKELEAFTYSVSHDLRAPLRAISGYTAILTEEYEPLLDAEGKRICAIIRSEAHRMSQLIDDLLNLSRMGRSPMQTVRLDMNRLVNTTITELTHFPEKTAAHFQVALLPTVLGDPILMRQVWHNLLSNAIKFSAKREQPVIEVGSYQTDDEIVYWVRDNGAGFDARFSEKLFGVFQRLHNEREFSGSGVGLAIVHRIVQRHNGRVWATGQVDHGATFFFALPVAETQYAIP